MNMKATVELAISGRDFDLPDMLEKIDVFYANDKLTKDERDELFEKARAAAKPENSMAPLMERMANMELAYKALEARVAALEGTETEDGTETPAEEYPAFVKPTGAHDAYSQGDKVTYEGKKYVSVYDGANVWPPDEYPAGWEEVTE